MPGPNNRDNMPDMNKLAQMKEGLDLNFNVGEEEKIQKQIPEQWTETPQVDMDRGRALIIVAHCIGLLTQAEENDDVPTRVFLSNAPGAIPGRNGGVRLFPDYDDSPVGIDRGGSASYDIEEVVIWIGKTFPDVLEKLEAGLTEVDDEAETEQGE